MAIVVNQEAQKPPIPISEQTKLADYVISLVEGSEVFAGLPVSLNFIDATKDCLCVRLTNESYKTAEYVDGSYEGQIVFSLIYRRLNVSGVDERLSAIDLVNQFGEALSEQEFITEIEDVEINSISQETPAGLIYRDNSGVEDNGANFILRFDHN